MNFRYVPIDSATADRFRRTGVDDYGNSLRCLVAPQSGRYPCRHCLSSADKDQQMLLGSYNLARPQGVYWTPSPIFVHADACERFRRDSELPEIIRTRFVSVRAYDEADQMIYELGAVSDGKEVDALAKKCLEDTRTNYVNVHTAGPGCFLCRIERD